MKLKGESIGKFLFHGTRDAVGTPAGNIRPPSVKQPFFVTDSIQVLGAYVGVFMCKSVWVMTCDPEELVRKSWYIQDPTCIGKLKTKMPKTAEFLEGRILLAKDHWKTLFDSINRFLTDVVSAFNEDQTDQKFVSRMKEILKEMDLLDVGDGGTVRPVKTIMDASEGEAIAWIEARRLVKSKILKAIEELGYKALADNETSGQNIDGYEFGILNKDLIKSAWSVSIDPHRASINSIIKEMHKES